MGNIINSKSTQIDLSIINALNMKQRPLAGHGVWLMFLLPLCVLISHVKNTQVSESYSLASILSFGLLFSSFTLFVTLLGSHNKSNFYTGLIFPFAFTCFRLYFIHERGLMFSVYCGMLTSYLFGSNLQLVMKLCPYCFSIGEGAVVTQALTLFLASSTDNIYRSWFNTPTSDMDIVTIILQVGLLGVLVISLTMFKMPFFHSTSMFYTLVFSVIFLMVIPSLQVLLNQNPVLWIFSLIFMRTPTTVYLLSYWLLCVGVACCVVVWQILRGEQATTTLRKYFHVLIVAVYCPGFIKACSLLYLASGVMLAIFIVLEMTRLFNIPPLGRFLQEGFAVYADEKDAGNLALTPIYLLTGCSLPLWLHPHACSSPSTFITLCSGLLSIGIGDTLASTIGSRFGKNRWPGTKKTVEGTVACVLGQFLTVFLIHLLGVAQFSSWTVLILFSSIITTSLVEAYTDQVDNLVLPLLSYLIMS